MYVDLEKMEISSNVIRKCWQNVLYERTLQRTGVVKEHHFSSLMRPFIKFGDGQPEQGSVVLQWLNLIAGEELVEQGKIIKRTSFLGHFLFGIPRTRFTTAMHFMISVALSEHLKQEIHFKRSKST